jgi:NADPH:quinone reductase-like Zn-dependent oxidoreductase
LQAITYHRYGSPDVLELEKVDPPVVGVGQVLVGVRAASVNPRDWHYLRGLPYIMRPVGLRIPKDGAFGSDVAGQVEAVGRAVTRFRPGDEVYAHVLAGAFAEQASVPEAALGPKPANLSFEQAAAVPLAGLTALQGCATTDASNRGSGSWSSAPRAASAASPCSSPSRSGRR